MALFWKEANNKERRRESSVRLNEDYRRMKLTHEKEASGDYLKSGLGVATGIALIAFGCAAINPDKATEASIMIQNTTEIIGVAFIALSAGYTAVKTKCRQLQRRSLKNDIKEAKKHERKKNGISDLAQREKKSIELITTNTPAQPPKRIAFNRKRIPKFLIQGKQR